MAVFQRKNKGMSDKEPESAFIALGSFQVGCLLIQIHQCEAISAAMRHSNALVQLLRIKRRWHGLSNGWLPSGETPRSARP